MRLIDSHGHVQAEPFAADLDEVLAAAALAGLERLLVPGWDLASSEAAVSLARREGLPLAVDAAAGIHPHVASGVDEAARTRLRELVADPAVVAVGETGLDYDRALSPRDVQLANLRNHLALALETGKPAILHCRSKAGQRDAQDDLIAELAAAGFGGPASRQAFGARPSAILHSFSGPPDYAAAALEMGLAISFSGLVFRRAEEASAEVARLVPGDRLLVETDAPYLAPPGAPRRRNAPEWVRVTAAWLAERRGDRPERLGSALVEAYDRVLGGSTKRDGGVLS